MSGTPCTCLLVKAATHLEPAEWEQNFHCLAHPGTFPKRPEYVYVASSWRNIMQVGVCAALRSAGIDHYDFKNPPGGTGFSWKEVKPASDDAGSGTCHHCHQPIALATCRSLGFWEPDMDIDPLTWRHAGTGYASCRNGATFALLSKGGDWEPIDDYLAMVNHPRALDGYASDFAAMQRADTFVLVLPCGKSAHLELGWAVGAGKRTAILLEDPVEPELMYRMVDFLAPSLFDLLGWLGVE